MIPRAPCGAVKTGAAPCRAARPTESRNISRRAGTACGIPRILGSRSCTNYSCERIPGLIWCMPEGQSVARALFLPSAIFSEEQRERRQGDLCQGCVVIPQKCWWESNAVTALTNSGGRHFFCYSSDKYTFLAIFVSTV